MKTYCVKQRRQTECVPSREQISATKNGRRMMKCQCAECSITKTRFVKGTEGGSLATALDIIPGYAAARKSLGTVVPMIIKEKGAKQAFDDFACGKTFKSAWAGLTGQQGRIQDEKMRKQGYTKMKKVSKREPCDAFANDSGPNWHRQGPYASTWERYRATWVRRHGGVKKWGGALARRRGPSSVDKAAYVMSNFVTPAPSFASLGRVLAGQAYKGVKDNVDYYRGNGLDIHKAVGKLPKPKGGWTLLRHHYTGPYNDLDKQLKYNPVTGEILEIYQKPTGTTDAIAMQHDVDYAVCGDDKKCKHRADDKMIQALDAVPKNQRQRGHRAARNAIKTNRKLGLGAKQGAQTGKKKCPKFKLARSTG